MRIACLGDSVTQGCFELIERPEGGFSVLTDSEFGYCTLLEAKWKAMRPEIPVEVINAGISGDSTEGAINRVKTNVIDRKPDIAVVCLGLNDVCSRNPETFEKNLNAIFDELAKAKIPTIYMTPNMMNTRVHPDTVPSAREIAVNTAACQNDGTMDKFMQTGINCALSHGFSVCDAYAEWKRLREIGVDTDLLLSNHINHPTRSMHRLFLKLLWEKIEQMNI